MLSTIVIEADAFGPPRAKTESGAFLQFGDKSTDLCANPSHLPLKGPLNPFKDKGALSRPLTSLQSKLTINKNYGQRYV